MRSGEFAWGNVHQFLEVEANTFAVVFRCFSWSALFLVRQPYLKELPQRGEVVTGHHAPLVFRLSQQRLDLGLDASACVIPNGSAFAVWHRHAPHPTPIGLFRVGAFVVASA